ncbi:MAG: replication protein P [Gammaproteobacteria bacterium]
METGRDLAERAARALAASSRTSPTAAGPTEAPGRDEDRIDAINQVFALFRLNYHNQYYRAFEDAQQLNQAKKPWLEALAAVDVESIRRGARRCIEDSEYLPTLHRMLESCHAARCAAQGLPAARDAYLEAATAPRDGHRWSHPAVWQAACEAGRDWLASAREAEALPVFERLYSAVCERLFAGETLALPPAAPAAAPAAGAEMSVAERREALRRLRAQTGV